eukprot:m.139141 g.139141  ORF g.139141 m.139141 type:complete len:84 (-) comp16083_c2_seq23:4669-4920(-)
MIMAVTCKTVSLSDISLSRELGAGAFGLVMLGSLAGREIVAKVISEDSSNRRSKDVVNLKKAAASLLVEAQALQNLSHPHIVS